MELTTGVNKRLIEANNTFKSLGCNACVEIVDDMNKNDNGDKASTVIIVVDGDRKYAAYASASSIALSTYLQGMQHGLQLIAGGYQFKAISAQAKIKPRTSVLKSKKDKSSLTRMDARIAPRFALQRSRFMEG